MEDELKCSYCRNFFCNPVLLPCSHSLCYACALDLQQKFNNSTTQTTPPSTTNFMFSQRDENFNTIKSNKSTTLTTTTKNGGGGGGDKMSALIESTLKLNRLLSNKSQEQASPTSDLDQSNTNIPSPSSISSSQSVSSSSSINIDHLTLNEPFGSSSIVSDLDKLSVFSEADSGVPTSLCNLNIVDSKSSNTVISSSSSSSSSSTSSGYSRPCSYMSNSSHMSSFQSKSNSSRQLPLVPAPVFSSSSSAKSLYSIYLPCPQCQQMIYMDETGIESLAKNTCLENIIERYMEAKKCPIKCQMCPPSALVSADSDSDNNKASEREAVVMCEQCETFYCEQCRECCHPMRGPLQKHSLVPVKMGRDLLRRKNKMRESKCPDHPSEQVSLYCMVCKSACCHLCVSDSVHLNHDMQQINLFSKSQKVTFEYLKKQTKKNPQ